MTNSINKLYDMVLCERLYHWFIPYREQGWSAEAERMSGACCNLKTPNRLARRKKIKIFVIFIDFSKAYDFVPRHKIFVVLKQAR